MQTDQELFLKVEKALLPIGASKEVSSERLLGVRVVPDKLTEALRILQDILGIRHLSTITGLDAGDQIEVDYHFWHGDKIVTVKTAVAKTDPKIETSTTIIPGSILYEMEVHDMFGVNFQGNPWMDRKLLLPDNYPADMPPPLLKSTSSEKIRKAVGIEK